MKKALQLLLVASALSGTAQAVTYSIKELPGLPGGGTGRGAAAINEKGQIAGSMRDAQGNEHAVVWDEKRNIRDLGTLPGHCISWAADINDLGQVVGWSSEADNRNKHAVLWEKDGTVKDLGDLGDDSVATAVNNKGYVVGYSFVKGMASAHAFLWKLETGMTDLGVLDGCTHSSAEDIDDAGRIVGRSSGSAATLHAVMWEAGGNIKDLNAVLNIAASNATAINSKGQIAGKAGWMCCKGNAFLWDPGKELQDLGRLLNLPKLVMVLPHPPPVPGSDAYALNDHGQVVGQSHDTRSHSHAFFWSTETGMIDLGALKDKRPVQETDGTLLHGLKTLVGDDEGWSAATDINNSGVIVGSSNGRAVMWVPVP